MAVAVPVWLDEDDLGCIICQELEPGRCAARAATSPLPKRNRNPSCKRSYKHRPASLGNISNPNHSVSFALFKVPVQTSIAEVVQELATLVGKLVDITKSMERLRPLSGSRPAEEVPWARSPMGSGGWGMARGSFPGSGVNLCKAAGRGESRAFTARWVLASSPWKPLSSLASLTLVTSSTSEGEMREILHDLEKIQEKLLGNCSWKEALDVQTPEAPSSSSCPRPDQSCLEPKRTSYFAQWAITPTFDLGSLSCSLEVSKDCRTVTVSHGQQNYPWSPQRFSASQVLCSQALSSGRQYWEVDTQYCNDWAIGVASWTMARNQMLGRTMDSWCIEWKGTGKLSAWTMAKETVLGSDRPGVVGIWLDLEEGKLAFYSVASQESLIYECEVSASSPLHPAFWLFGLRWGNSLIIKQARV
ncbi:LOW QUALITY PROTEIN: E3 ubiquitin-protein ligase RNF135 [Fukomys damarensis]|uniref:LOW QUALITY PROTEIN: E3 ubiquitin-protein ligase RNF135 n=1 Tax=Fukomys damarensis TaxID=885580 RepID=UPI001455C5F7|nr:LOW QUALITY PROTEIN: E3 ubiquitin-protein ligase RNF135 [Fukomys damarensis]